MLDWCLSKRGCLSRVQTPQEDGQILVSEALEQRHRDCHSDGAPSRDLAERLGLTNDIDLSRHADRQVHPPLRQAILRACPGRGHRTSAGRCGAADARPSTARRPRYRLLKGRRCADTPMRRYDDMLRSPDQQAVVPPDRRLLCSAQVPRCADEKSAGLRPPGLAISVDAYR